MPDNNALHTASKEGDLVETQSQVSNFDINAMGEYDETALVQAAENGYTDIVKFLLTLKADVNIPSVSTLKMMPIHHLICIILSLISVLYPTFYTSRYVLLSLVVKESSSSTQYDFINSPPVLFPYQYNLFCRSSVFLHHLDTYTWVRAV